MLCSRTVCVCVFVGFCLHACVFSWSCLDLVCLCMPLTLFCVYCACVCVCVCVCVCLQEYPLLYEEAGFFQLTPLQAELQRWRTEQECGGGSLECECVVIHVAPELGERISVSAHRAVIEEVFPEARDAISNSLNSWNQDSSHIIRFPLTSYCRLNSVQVQMTLWIQMSNPLTPMSVRDQTVMTQLFSGSAFLFAYFDTTDPFFLPSSSVSHSMTYKKPTNKALKVWTFVQLGSVFGLMKHKATRSVKVPGAWSLKCPKLLYCYVFPSKAEYLSADQYKEGFKSFV